MNVKLARTDEDILKCWSVIHQLRPHLQQQSFTGLVKTLIAEGYNLAYIEVEGQGVSAIGFRYQNFLFNGKHFYIDDLVTLPEHRGKGYAGQLLDYVFDLAKEKGYKHVTLDSGYHRHDAHRLYLNKGFAMITHHFQKTLE
jgi:GNAT superfamily N-acetyltransferase